LILPPSDDVTGAGTIPFTFRFYATSTTTFFASSNGVLGFGLPNTSYTNSCLPGTLFNAILPFWDDLYVEVGPVCTATTGSAPNRRQVISWTAVRPFLDTGNMNFMVSLFETSNIVEIAYGTMTSGVAGRAQGNSATVGVVNATGSAFTQSSCNTPSVIAFSSIRFTPM